MSKITASLLAFALCLLLSAAAAAAAPRYRITVIESGNVTPDPGPRVNDAGMVSGSARVPGDPNIIKSRAFRWTVGQGLVFAPLVDGNSTTAAACLDRSGRIVADWRKPEWPARVLTWEADGSTALLDQGTVIACNDRGDVLGASGPRLGPGRVMWRADGRRVRIDPPPGAAFQALNDRGQATGYIYDAFATGVRDEAAVWTASGETIRIGFLPGSIEPESYGVDINDAGEVAGHGYDANRGFTPFYWSASSGILPIYPDGFCGYGKAVAINALGVIAGDAYSCISGGGAWLWSRADGVLWVKNLIARDDPLRKRVSLQRTFDLNATGQLVMWGQFEGRYATILLTPDE